MIDEHTQQRLRERYNPDGSALRTLQLQLLEMLKEFDTICKRNGIPYWLDSGTLIGAVRHGGFIPWDDDVDVCVLKKDQKRLREVMQRELKQPLRYVDEKVDRTYPRKWARIVMPMTGQTTNDKSIWLDIFIMEYGNRRLFDLANKTYGKCYRRKTGLIRERWWKRLLIMLAYVPCWLLMLVIRAVGRCCCKDTLIFDYGGVFRSIRKTNDIFPIDSIPFENENFCVPHNWDSYLKLIYGSYELPPEQKRFAHNVICK